MKQKNDVTSKLKKPAHGQTRAGKTPGWKQITLAVKILLGAALRRASHKHYETFF
jgi:hypothetical protein